MSRGLTSPRLQLEWLPGRYAVCRLEPSSAIPPWALSGPTPQAARLVSITRTDRELSIVVDESLVPADTTLNVERGFDALRIVGALDFSVIGVLARLTGALADAKVPVFVISTFDTDLLLVRHGDCERAGAALAAVAHLATPPPRAARAASRRSAPR